jgi:hypothetical protein
MRRHPAPRLALAVRGYPTPGRNVTATLNFQMP